MTMDGVWTGEVEGAFGWVKSGIFFLQNGQTMGGDDRMYCSGRHSVSGDSFEADWSVQFFGKPLTVFGEAKEKINVRLAGTVDKEVIDAVMQNPIRPKYELRFRLTRRLDLPTA